MPDGRDGTLYRVPPLNHEAEVGVLGAILASNRAYDTVSDFLRAEHFADARHGQIFEAASKLIAAGAHADAVTLKDHFAATGALDKLGGAEYLARLQAACLTPILAESYGRTVHDRAVRRRAIDVAAQLSDAAYAVQFDETAEGIVGQAQAELGALLTEAVATGPEPIAQATQRTLAAALRAYQDGTGIVGVPTHLTALDELMGGMKAGELIVAAGRPGMGKAQPLGARVLTTRGWKLMGDMKAGDALASVDGTPSYVTAVFDRGEMLVYTVTFSDGRTAQCTADHLWRVSYRGWAAPRVLPTSKIMSMLGRTRYRGRLWIDLPNGEHGAAWSSLLPVDPWVLGLLIGDGCRNVQSVRLSSADTEIVEHLRYRLGDEYRVSDLGRDSWNIVERRGRSRIRAALTELGLWAKKAEEKFIPRVYLDADREARLWLLRGLIDSDGWVEKFNCLRYATSSPQLAADVAELARSLGALCQTAKRMPFAHKNGERKAGLPSYTLTIRHQDGRAFAWLPRKKARLARRRSSPRLTITSIEPAAAAQVRCISVSHPTGLYITDNYVVTHNSDAALCIAWRNASLGRRVLFFQFEMSAEQLGARVLAAQTGHPAGLIMRGRFNQAQYNVMHESAAGLDWPLYVDDTPRLSVAQMVARAKALEPALVIVDHIGLVPGDVPGAQYRGKVEQTAAVSGALKAMAKSLRCPVLALCQLNREVEKRQDNPRPTLADLRWAGEIEQDADAVLFLYRAEYYLAKTPKDERDTDWINNYERTKGRAEIIVAKNRMGVAETVHVAYEPAKSLFFDLSSDDAETGSMF